MTDAAMIGRRARGDFGFDELRPGQAEAIGSILSGRDTLVVMPTGSGKSAIYQIAGLELDGPTVVVSPLLALQRDQVESINGHDITGGGAAELNSTLTRTQRADLLDDLDPADGDHGVEYVFLAPEQLARSDTIDALAAAKPSLFVVDEAHCISSWGHDFRSDYLRLGAVVEALDHPVVLALTATASPPVQDEIVGRLGMRDAELLVRGFERENIDLGVRRCADDRSADQTLVETVDDLDGTGLVYVGTRARAEELAERLDRPERPARAYHAGLDDRVRCEVHDRFGEPEPVVVCATTAFGLGVDVPHVRFVVHDIAPESLDAYYQELGRAGRDGAPAAAVLVDRIGDDGVRSQFAGSSRIEADIAARLLAGVRAEPEPLPLEVVADGEEVTETRLLVAVSRLEDLDAVSLTADGAVVAGGNDDPIDAVVCEAVERQDAFGRAERSRADLVAAYISTRRCRWRQLLDYFGEGRDGPCGHCDVCRSGTEDPGEAVDLAPGDAVEHAEFGAGSVVSATATEVTIRFDDGDHRSFDLDFVRDAGLLTRP